MCTFETMISSNTKKKTRICVRRTSTGIEKMNEREGERANEIIAALSLLFGFDSHIDDIVSQ